MSRIGQLLLEENRISQDQLDFCVEFKKANPQERLGAVLKYHGFIDDAHLAEALSKQIGWPVYSREFVPDRSIIEQVGVDFLAAHQMFPLKNGSCPTFVISYIDNTEVTDLLERNFGLHEVKFYIGLEKDVRRALDSMFVDEKRRRLESSIESLRVQGRQAVASLMDELINLAILSRASDIHIEPTDKSTRIRFRIDGLLVPICCHQPQVITNMANFLLAKCNCPLADYKVQDGSFYHEYKDFKKEVDVRMAQSPSIYGPVITLRLLHKEDARPLADLGYGGHHLALIMQAARKPEGIMLVTGPTGSGKSTTLSAILHQCKSIGKKIWTAENPVERTIPLVNQLEINPAQGMTYAQSIRAFLRQDPDIISIGEIRDPETAHEAIMAANLGIQIFSTLHCNNPVSAITRLKDLGVEPFNISSFLNTVVSQRLVRKLCPWCKRVRLIHKSGLKTWEGKYLMKDVQEICLPSGCGQCKSGYLNRTVIAEVLVIDEEVAGLISRDRLVDLSALLRDRGTYKPMAEDVKLLIAQGETSIEEAVRVLG